MAFSSKKPPSSRYSSYDSRSSVSSSQISDPSSSSEFKPRNKPSPSSAAVVQSKTKNANQNLMATVQRFMNKKTSAAPAIKPGAKLVIPNDPIAEDLKKTARKVTGSNFSGLHSKLFGKEKKKQGTAKEVKALTEVKGNTRTLAMVLRSERELLSVNKEQEVEIARLNTLLEEKNNEVEKLKDLCLKQREEIKALKDAILFPDEVNFHLQELLEKQGHELNHAKQQIPTLQRQVTSLTGQLQCLAEDLAEVKAGKACFQCKGSSPQTPNYDHEGGFNSLEFSSGDPATPGSPDDLFSEDLNPCLTPEYVKAKSREFEVRDFFSSRDGSFS